MGEWLLKGQRGIKQQQVASHSIRPAIIYVNKRMFHVEHYSVGVMFMVSVVIPNTSATRVFIAPISDITESISSKTAPVIVSTVSSHINKHIENVRLFPIRAHNLQTISLIIDIAPHK